MNSEDKNEIYFYGTSGKYGFLSNFYRASFKYNDVEYWCVEQFFMKCKQKYFDPENTELGEAIMKSQVAKMIKFLGRRVRNFDENQWYLMKYDIMKQAVYLKFSQNPELAKALLETNEKMLYEDSRTDTIWGIGPYGTGENLLGKILMEVRKILKFSATV